MKIFGWFRKGRSPQSPVFCRDCRHMMESIGCGSLCSVSVIKPERRTVDFVSGVERVYMAHYASCWAVNRDGRCGLFTAKEGRVDG
jgi:hypothetical protein